MQSKRQWSDTFKLLKKKSLSTQNPKPCENIFQKLKAKMNVSGKQNPRDISLPGDLHKKKC